MLADFFQPYTWYRILRDVDHAKAGEELTFLKLTYNFDHFMGYEYYLITFAEKDLRVDNIAQDTELLNYPERFFLAIRTAEATDSDQRYDMRRERDQTEAAERSRLQRLELVQRKLEKRKR